MENTNLENVVERSASHSSTQPAARMQPARPPGAPAPFDWLKRGWATALVLLLIGGLAYWGHATNWEFRKFSELIGDSAAKDDDWCQEHSVPESVCVECQPALLPRFESTWCAVHGVHNCPFERPEIVQLPTPPQFSAADLERAQRALALKPRQENSPTCKLHERRLQLASEEAMEQMGIEVDPVKERPIVETIAVSGEVVFDGPRVAPIFTPVAGRIWRLTDKAKLGAPVRRGDVLALVDSPEVGKAKAEFLQAYAQRQLRDKTLDNLNALARQGIVGQTRLLEADTAAREARIRALAAEQALLNLGLPIRADDFKNVAPEELGKRLLFLGLPEAIAGQLDARTTTANLMPVTAARDGVVTAAKVAPGETADAAKILFVVTDASQMWLVLNVRGEDVRYLRPRDAAAKVPGQRVYFRPDGAAEDVTGELAWVGTAVDEKTRTVPVRVQLPNADGKLLAHTFGTGRIVLREEPKAVTIPNGALHWDKSCHVVFVQDKNFKSAGAPKVFHVRTVRPGVRNGSYTEIIAGLVPGEYVADENSAVLRAELLKGDLGKGDPD